MHTLVLSAERLLNGLHRYMSTFILISTTAVNSDVLAKRVLRILFRQICVSALPFTSCFPPLKWSCIEESASPRPFGLGEAPARRESSPFIVPASVHDR